MQGIDWFVNGPAPADIVGASNPADSAAALAKARQSWATYSATKAISPAREPASRILINCVRWRVIDGAINRDLDRPLLALRAHWPNRAVGDKALTDLVALVDQVSGKVKRAPMEEPI